MKNVLVIAVLFLAACQQQSEPVPPATGQGSVQIIDSDPQFLNSEEFARLGLPFSEAVRVGNILYLSGNIGIEPGTVQLVPGGAAEETRQTLENIKSTVELFGSSMERVFKCTVFMADNAERTIINEVYSRYFPENPPVRSGVGANGLALGARVEIECIASLPDNWQLQAEKSKARGSRRPFL
jgi:reactive intermediate/imine deaminase